MRKRERERDRTRKQQFTVEKIKKEKKQIKSQSFEYVSHFHIPIERKGFYKRNGRQQFFDLKYRKAESFQSSH